VSRLKQIDNKSGDAFHAGHEPLANGVGDDTLCRRIVPLRFDITLTAYLFELSLIGMRLDRCSIESSKRFFVWIDCSLSCPTAHSVGPSLFTKQKGQRCIESSTMPSEDDMLTKGSHHGGMFRSD